MIDEIRTRTGPEYHVNGLRGKGVKNNPTIFMTLFILSTWFRLSLKPTTTEFYVLYFSHQIGFVSPPLPSVRGIM